MESVLLLGTSALLCTSQLRHAIQRLNVQRRRRVVALAGAELEVLVATPEDDVSAPISAIGRCRADGSGD